MTLEPCERSETYVNGKRVAQPVQLRSGEPEEGSEVLSDVYGLCEQLTVALYLKAKVT